jgi:hypothetical protein
MDNETKNFHFMEFNWVISFPKCGNRGKYLNYTVTLMDMKEGKPQNGKLGKLEEVVENRDFENSYPHTVGFYKNSSGDAEFKPEYLEIRKINNVEELWLFLNALDI